VATTPCVCVGGGGGCSVANTTVEEYLAAFGYAYDSDDPLSDTYQSIMSAIVTKDNPSGNVPAWKALCEACLRARSLLYCSNTPGDCGTTHQATNQAALTNLQTLGVAGQLSGQGIQIGSTIANLAGAGGALLSGVTFGASALLQGILTIFENHAKAEQQQASVLCQLCPQVTAAIIATDAAIYAGSDSQNSGITNVQEIAVQFRAAVAKFTHGADAFAGYAAICDALAMETSYLYMIAFSSQSVTAPPNIATAVAPATQAAAAIVEANGLSAGNAAIASTGINAAIVPATSLFSSLPSWFWLLAVAGIFLAFSGSGSQETAA
jgi:hypothetical protein